MNARGQKVGPAGAESPVFVYGALRSGTTLLRVMLKAHAELQSPGEADFLFDHIVEDASAPDGWRYDRDALFANRIFRAKQIAPDPDLDGRALLEAMIGAMAAKEPGRLFVSIHRHARRMAGLFPKAPIIHLVRDPRDVARSVVGRGWSGTGYHGVRPWIETERDWDSAAIDPAQVHSLAFEALMADTEARLADICAFLGLDFHPAMRRYWEGSTYGPPEPQIAEQWRMKASPREIALIEGRVGDLLMRRGYTPAADPVTPGGLERALLATQDRIRRLRFNTRKYGTGLVLGNQAARLIGLRGAQKRLDARIEDIKIKKLK